MATDDDSSLNSDQEYDFVLSKLGEAVEPNHSMVSVNETLTLYRGPITIEFGQGLKIANATLTWEWRRKPIILCCYSPTEQQRMTGNATDVFGKAHKVVFDDLGVGSWASHHESHSCGGTRHQALKIVSPIVIGEIIPAKKVKIHLVNCHDRSEEAVRTAGGGYDGSGRLRLMSNDWEILIDKVPEHDKLERHLNKYGGQAITHVAQVSRRDGTAFDVDAADEVLRHIRDFLAFATGSKPQICLASGFLDEDTPVWQKWESCAPSQWIPLSNWSTQPFVCGQVGRAFPQYLEKMLNVDWSEAISLSIEAHTAFRGGGVRRVTISDSSRAFPRFLAL